MGGWAVAFAAKEWVPVVVPLREPMLGSRNPFAATMKMTVGKGESGQRGQRAGGGVKAGIYGKPIYGKSMGDGMRA
ncbi:hypothetical protein T484DRAFT_1857710 [Baffinella frigidus]|nr:hypothetical protein T484DRAFT_1857710 [Cryptophyta sp. CCMP2293]